MGENQERISELEKLRNLKAEYEREEMTQEQAEKLRKTQNGKSAGQDRKEAGR